MVVNMNVIYLSVVSSLSLILLGCGGDSGVTEKSVDDSKVSGSSSVPIDVSIVDGSIIPDVPDVPDVPEQSYVNFITPWINNPSKEYLSENYVTYNPVTSVTEINGNIIYTINFEKSDSSGNKTFGFDDVTFEVIGPNDYFIVNNTPDKILKLLVSTNNYNTPVLITLNSMLSPFSRTRVSFQENLENIRLVNTMGMFLPEITLNGDFSAQEGSQCGDTCFSKPTEQQAEVYGILTSNLHKAMNHKRFLNEMLDFYGEEWCVPNYSGCNSDMANIFYMRLGARGHKLGLSVLSGPYSVDGTGSGTIPSLVDVTAESSGTAAIWRNYITEGATNSRPFASRTQEALFREVAHGYGFIDAFGMTENGFSVRYGSEVIESDQYFTNQEMTSASELKPSSIVPVLVDAGDKYIKYRLLKLEEEDDISAVYSRVITQERLSRRDRFIVENN